MSHVPHIEVKSQTLIQNNKSKHCSQCTNSQVVSKASSTICGSWSDAARWKTAKMFFQPDMIFPAWLCTICAMQLTTMSRIVGDLETYVHARTHAHTHTHTHTHTQTHKKGNTVEQRPETRTNSPLLHMEQCVYGCCMCMVQRSSELRTPSYRIKISSCMVTKAPNTLLEQNNIAFTDLLQ